MPNFGAFLPKRKKATFNIARDIITPPKTFWNFDSMKETNSNVFIKAVAEGENLDISEAELKIKEQVDKWKVEFIEKSILKVDGLGLFSKSSMNNQIIFTYSEQVEDVQAEFYGLKPLKIREKLKKVLPLPSSKQLSVPKQTQKVRDEFVPKQIVPKTEDDILEGNYEIEEEIYYDDESGISQKTLLIIIIVFLSLITPIVLDLFEILDLTPLFDMFSSEDLKTLEES